MTQNFTTLALNLLISERESQRELFLEKILSTKPLHELFKTTPDFKANFMAAVIACVENPASEARDDFYRFAVFCDEKISQSELSAA